MDDEEKEINEELFGKLYIFYWYYYFKLKKLLLVIIKNLVSQEKIMHSYFI